MTSALVFATPAATVPTPTSETSFTCTRARRVDVLQVVDQLGQVLDGVDVVVRRRRDQPDAGRRVAGLRDPRPHLVAGQLAALAGLGALGHLDLQVVGVHQVLGGDAEPSAGDLLDGRAAGRVVQPLDVLAALAGVGLAAEAVHRDREGLVRLGRDRAVRHRAGGEPLDDLADRLDLVQRHRRTGTRCAARTGRAASRPRSPAGRPRRVYCAEDVVLARPGGVLEQEHRLRVEQVQLALAAPLVLAADLEPAVRPLGRRWPGTPCRGGPRPRRAISARPMPPILRRRAGEVALHQVGCRARPPRRPGRRCTRTTVEMPILDMIFRTPLPSALT